MPEFQRYLHLYETNYEQFLMLYGGYPEQMTIVNDETGERVAVTFDGIITEEYEPEK